MLKLIITLFVLILFQWAGCQLAVAADSSKISIDNIPKLMELFEFRNYKETVASGTLLPDRFNWDSLSLRTGMYETDFNSSIPDSTLVCEKPELRSREEHWKFIRELLWKNNYSMHYYILADIYYDKQIHGWFRKCEWSIDGIGKLIIYRHSEKEQEKYRVWLLQLVLDPVPPKSVKYTHAPGLSVIRLGEPEMHWDIDKNQVFVYSKE